MDAGAVAVVIGAMVSAVTAVLAAVSSFHQRKSTTRLEERKADQVAVDKALEAQQRVMAQMESRITEQANTIERLERRLDHSEEEVRACHDDKRELEARIKQLEAASRG